MWVHFQYYSKLLFINDVIQPKIIRFNICSMPWELYYAVVELYYDVVGILWLPNWLHLINRVGHTIVLYFYTSPPNSTPMTVHVLPSLDPSLIFPFHVLPSQVHPTGFSFCFSPGFFAIFILLSSNNNNMTLHDLIILNHKLVLLKYIYLCK